MGQKEALTQSILVAHCVFLPQDPERRLSQVIEKHNVRPTLSSGEPKGINCKSFLSLKSRFVVSSNFLVMWSRASGVPYFEFLSFSR